VFKVYFEFSLYNGVLPECSFKSANIPNAVVDINKVLGNHFDKCDLSTIVLHKLFLV